MNTRMQPSEAFNLRDEEAIKIIRNVLLNIIDEEKKNKRTVMEAKILVIDVK